MTKKTKKLAILLVAIIATGSMFFASCNDENEENLLSKKITERANTLKQMLESGEVAQLDSLEFEQYVKEVTKEFGVNINQLSQHYVLKNIGSVIVPSYYLDAIKNGTLTDEMQTKLQEHLEHLSQVMNNEDTSAIEKEIVLAYNFIFHTQKTSSEIFGDDNPLLIAREEAKRNIEKLEKDFPNLKNLDEDDKIFVVSVAKIKSNYDDGQISGTLNATISCETMCDKLYRMETTIAVVKACLKTIACIELVFTPVQLGCIIWTALQYMDSMQNASDNYFNCIESCGK